MVDKLGIVEGILILPLVHLDTTRSDEHFDEQLERAVIVNRQ